MNIEPQTPTGILLFNIRAMPCESVAAALDDSDIAVRAGLHCCPAAHGLLGTRECGAVRMSFGIFNEHAQVGRVFGVIKRLCASRTGG